MVENGADALNLKDTKHRVNRYQKHLSESGPPMRSADGPPVGLSLHPPQESSTATILLSHMATQVPHTVRSPLPHPDVKCHSHTVFTQHTPFTQHSGSYGILDPQRIETLFPQGFRRCICSTTQKAPMSECCTEVSMTLMSTC